MTGFEPLIAAATTGVTSIVTDIIKKEGTNAFTKLLSQDLSNGAKQKIFNASKKYIENYTKRHCTLKVLGMREPVSLDDVYTAVVLLDSAGRQSFTSIEELEKAYRENPIRTLSRNPDKKRIGVKVANNTQFLMVLGAPGAGKSTFLRKIGLEALKVNKGGYKYRCLPVLLELKRFTEDQIDVQQLIVNEFKLCGFPNPKGFTEKALKQGKLLILLDGLDEVPTAKRDTVIDIIQDFVDQYDQNRFISSCRIAAYRNNFRRFTDVVMAEFGDDQIEKYIQNWFHSEEDLKSETAKRYWKLLKKTENSAAKELAHTPLLLTFLCLVYDRSQAISNNRSTLYRKALRILLEEWAAEKRIMPEEIYQGLDVQLEEILLTEIAYERFEADRLFMTQDDLVNSIKNFLATNLNAPQHLSGEKVLNSIAIQQGILVERAEDIFSFSHLTLQEYLAAKYIVDNNRVNLLVEQHFADKNWREIFLLVSGSMLHGNGADTLFLEMGKRVQQISLKPKLQKLLQWVNRALVPQDSVDNSLLLRMAMMTFASASILDLDTILDFANDLIGDLATVLDRVRSSKIDGNATTVRVRDIDLALALDLAFDSDPYIALGRTCTIDNDSTIGSAFILALARAIALALDFASTLDLELISAVDSVHALKRARALDTSLNLDLAFTHIFARILLHYKESIFTGISSSDFRKIFASIQTKRPSITEPRVKHKEFADQIFSLQYKFFHIKESMLNFGQEEASLLESYLYMNTLIIQCKKEAIRVSPDTWKSVAQRMLIPS